MTSPRVLLGLGANVGNRLQNLRSALAYLRRECDVLAVSSLYVSTAVVVEGAAPGPDYFNAAAEVATPLTPEDLLRLAKQIEHDLGRRPADRWAPRPIDIDLLMYGDLIIETEALVVPHRRLAERNFVLRPLAEIAPDAMHPVLKRTIAVLAATVSDEGLRRIAGADWAASTEAISEGAEG